MQIMLFNIQSNLLLTKLYNIYSNTLTHIFIYFKDLEVFNLLFIYYLMYYVLYDSI